MTVDKIAWIIGLKLGVMHESQDVWIKKIKGRDRIRRVYKARSIVCVALHDFLGVSYQEIAHLLGDRNQSSVGNSIMQGRKWIDASNDNYKLWCEIVRAIEESTAAEQAHHAKANLIKVGLSD